MENKIEFAKKNDFDIEFQISIMLGAMAAAILVISVLLLPFFSKITFYAMLIACPMFGASAFITLERLISGESRHWFWLGMGLAIVLIVATTLCGIWIFGHYNSIIIPRWIPLKTLPV